MEKGSGAVKIVILLVLFLFGAYIAMMFIGGNIGGFSFDFSNIPILGQIQNIVAENFVDIYRISHG